ncbi:MAG: gliding motility protein GldN [Bacteroidaceae bacterium]|nr:gliding motility protein GldN [Bacteroidaceae bacterium]
MRRIITTIIVVLTLLPAVAQPPARQRQTQRQNAQQQQQKSVAVSERAQLEYPTAPTMPDDVAWRRDLYRVLDLNKDKNAVLYYPEEPEGDKMNLFTFLFKLIMSQQVKAYEYSIDGKENFKASNELKRGDMLNKFKIRHQEQNGRFRIEDNDIPSAEVKSYYVKESTYFDQHTASFRKQVTAICPVREEGDEWGAGTLKVPMFWLKYEDIAPFLAKLELMASNYNNAAMISADDYFNTAQYEGEIYKTNNLQGRVISDSTAMREAQKRITSEMQTLEAHVWGGDSLRQKADSTETAQATTKAKGKQTTTAKKESESTSSRSQLKRQKSNGGSSSSNSSPRISVRRQRH